MKNKKAFSKFVGAQQLSRSELKKIMGGVADGGGGDVPTEGGGSNCMTDKYTTYYDCMQCLVVEKCGGDWVCMAVCGINVPACLGAASIMCLTKQSHDIKNP